MRCKTRLFNVITMALEAPRRKCK